MWCVVYDAARGVVLSTKTLGGEPAGLSDWEMWP